MYMFVLCKNKHNRLFYLYLFYLYLLLWLLLLVLLLLLLLFRFMVHYMSAVCHCVYIRLFPFAKRSSPTTVHPNADSPDSKVKAFKDPEDPCKSAEPITGSLVKP